MLAVLGTVMLLPFVAPAHAGSYAFGSDSDFEYALVEPGADGDRTISSSGSWGNVERVLEKNKGPLL